MDSKMHGYQGAMKGPWNPDPEIYSNSILWHPSNTSEGAIRPFLCPIYIYRTSPKLNHDYKGVFVKQEMLCSLKFHFKICLLLLPNQTKNFFCLLGTFLNIVSRILISWSGLEKKFRFLLPLKPDCILLQITPFPHSTANKTTSLLPRSKIYGFSFLEKKITSRILVEQMALNWKYESYLCSSSQLVMWV